MASLYTGRHTYGNRLNSCAPWLILVLVICFGVLLLLISWISARNASEVSALPVVSAVALADSAEGREVLVEGTISPNMRPAYATLVAYERQYERSDGDEREWVTSQVHAPPLLLDTASGRVRIETTAEASAYEFAKVAETIYDEHNSNIRYRGFRVNDEVLARGVVRTWSEGRALDAEFIYHGTQQSYIADQRFMSTLLFWIGLALIIGPFWVAGLLLYLRFR
jgi:hypothetical protein